MTLRGMIALGLLAIASTAFAQTPAVPSNDVAALEAVGLKVDQPTGLIAYLKTRTLSDSDLATIKAVIQRLGADDFDTRVAAAKEVERFGPAAIGPLRAVARSDNDDFEVAYRAAECLRRLEKVPHAAVASAAIRGLAAAKVAAAVPVLLGYLPVADTPAVADDVRVALAALAVSNDQPNPALVAALTDPHATRRVAAALALIGNPPGGNPVRPSSAYPKIRDAVNSERDQEAKFLVTFAMATVAKDPTAIGPLANLLPTLPRGRLWQTEDFLLQLAGPDAPKVVLGKTPASLDKARTEWQSWWDKASTKTDLAKFVYEPRVSGKTVLVLMDGRFGGPGAVVELGPDLKERWRIPGLSNPMDAQFLPDGNVVIAEHNSNRVTIRDTAGKIIATRMIGGQNRTYGNPQQVQLLPDGNILVTCRNVIVEFKKDKDEVAMQYVRQNYDITAAHRLATGETLVFVQNGPQHAIFLDAKGVEIKDRKLKTGMPFYQAHAAAGGTPDRVLLTELNQVAEYDLKENKTVWTKAIQQPRSVQRLPNGNTLIVDGTGNRLVEFTPDGEEVWTYQPTEGFQVFRGYRR